MKPSGSVFKAWIPALVWLALIAIESTSALSASNTGRILYPLFHFLLGLDPVRFEDWNFYLRKLGHFTGYFVLSWLLFRAWRPTLPLPGVRFWALRWAAIAWSMSALVAGLDEWHQTYLPARTGRFRDVLLDSFSALAAQALLWLLLRRKERR